jgi:hypothetical protein
LRLLRAEGSILCRTPPEHSNRRTSGIPRPT